MLKKAGVLAALAIILMLVFFRPGGGKGPDGQEKEVLLGEAVVRSFSVTVEAVGELDAARSTVVSSSVRGDKGKILWIVEDGRRVEEGEVLIRLDPTFFEEEVQRLETQTRENETMLQAQEQSFEYEKIQVERQLKTAEFEKNTARLDLETLEKGDGPLEMARLEGAMLDAQTQRDAKKAYVAALENLEERGHSNPAEIFQAREQVKEAVRAYEVARRQFESYRDYAFPARLEQARTRVARTEMELDQILRGKVFQLGRTLTAVHRARKDLDDARLGLERARQELESTVIRAPIAGMAVLREDFIGGQKRKPRVGDPVWQNQPLIYLPDIASMVVRTQVREVDVHKVGAGKPCVVYVDAYPDLRLTGEVQQIGVLAETNPAQRGGEKFFRITARISDQDMRLRPGMTARVIIQCAEIEAALTVPAQAVYRDRDRDYCFVRQGGFFEKQEVTVGAQSENLLQILSGLSAGDQVALSRPPAEKIAPARLSGGV